jgi:hypothetical protein
MTMAMNIPPPPQGFAGTWRYTIRPRENHSFTSVLSAAQLIEPPPNNVSLVSFSGDGDGDDVVLVMEHPIVTGRMVEEIHCARTRLGLITRSISRVGVLDGIPARREEAFGFQYDSLGYPTATYPEVCLPFMIGWLPFDGTRRALYAWVNDRFVARMYLESKAPSRVALPGGLRSAVEVIMYPDLNDWVPLGGVLTRLAKPFLPKYRMWYEPAAPHTLLRFEGPYGPPGAPELVLELVAKQVEEQR